MDFLDEELIVQKSSQELTALMYEGLLNHLGESITHIEQNEMMDANKKLQKASDILQRLGVGLRYDAGLVAENLDTIYNYLANQIIKANVKKDIDQIKHILEIVQTLNNAWNEALTIKQNNTSDSIIKKVSAYENSVMRSKI